MATCAEVWWASSEDAALATWTDFELGASFCRSAPLARCARHCETAEKKNLAPSEDRTAIVLDWDDTLFPLTHVYCDLHLDLRKPLQEQRIPEAMKKDVAEKLSRCCQEVIRLLRLATTLGEVMIVTLSKDSWVAESCRNFFPELQECISKLGVRVLHATPGEQRGGALSTFSRLKAEAIAAATGATGASAWRSLISIGDSDFEREGCRRAAEDLQKREAPASQVIHAKTLKSMEKPTVDELTKQLQYISRWLPRMVALCSDLDLTLSDVEDESLQVIEDYLRTLE